MRIARLLSLSRPRHAAGWEFLELTTISGRVSRPPAISAESSEVRAVQVVNERTLCRNGRRILAGSKNRVRSPGGNVFAADALSSNELPKLQHISSNINGNGGLFCNCVFKLCRQAAYSEDGFEMFGSGLRRFGVRLISRDEDDSCGRCDSTNWVPLASGGVARCYKHPHQK